MGFENYADKPFDYNNLMNIGNTEETTKQQKVKQEEIKQPESHWGYTITAYKNGQKVELTAEQYAKLESLVKEMLKEKPALKDLKSLHITAKDIRSGEKKVDDTDQKTFDKMQEVLTSSGMKIKESSSENVTVQLKKTPPKISEKSDAVKKGAKKLEEERKKSSENINIELKKTTSKTLPNEKVPEKKESTSTETKESSSGTINIELKKTLPKIPEKKKSTSTEEKKDSTSQTEFKQTGGHPGALVRLKDKPGYIQKREVKKGKVKTGGMKNERTMYKKINTDARFEKLRKFTPEVALEDTNDDSLVMEDLSNKGQNTIHDIKLGHDLFSKTIHKERRDPKGVGGKISTSVRTLRMGLYSKVVGEYSVQGSKKIKDPEGAVSIKLPFGVSIQKLDEEGGSKTEQKISKKFNSTLESLGRIQHSRTKESKKTMQGIINGLTPENKTKIYSQLNELKKALKDAPTAFYGSSILIVTGTDAKGKQTAELKFIDVGNFLTEEEVQGDPKKMAEYNKLKENSSKAIDSIIEHGNLGGSSRK